MIHTATAVTAPSHVVSNTSQRVGSAATMTSCVYSSCVTISTSE